MSAPNDLDFRNTRTLDEIKLILEELVSVARGISNIIEATRIDLIAIRRDLKACQK